MTDPLQTFVPPETDDLLMAGLEPLSRGEEWDFELVKHGLRSASAAVRDVVSGDPGGAQRERARLERAYGFLAAYTEGHYERTRAFMLGRIASLLNLAACAVPHMSRGDFDSLLDPELEEGETKLTFLQEIAKRPRRPTDMARHVPRRSGSEDQGMSAASKHLKQLMLAGYLIRERKGREVYYSLTAAGRAAVLRPALGDDESDELDIEVTSEFDTMRQRRAPVGRAMAGAAR